MTSFLLGGQKAYFQELAVSFRECNSIEMFFFSAELPNLSNPIIFRSKVQGMIVVSVSKKIQGFPCLKMYTLED